MIFTAVLSFSAHAEVPKELLKVQREGNAYYRGDLKASGTNAAYKVPHLFEVLPKNSVGSCSNTAAIKAVLARKLGYYPLIASFRMHSGAYHAVVVIKKPGVDSGWWLLNNDTNWVREYDTLRGLDDLFVAPLSWWQLQAGVKK